MRNIFIKNLVENAKENKNLYVLTGDLGYRAFEPFRDEFPDRFLNVGIAEANMAGIAAGLALSEKKVCIYSIAPFLAFRSLEQIRNDICYQNLDVKLIAAGGGFSYGNQGYSHNTSEDLAIMRSLPNISIFNPGDNIEAELAVKAALSNSGPVYLRLGKAGKRKIYQEKPDFFTNKGILVRPGHNLTLMSTGNIIEVVLTAAELLEKEGFSAKIISMPCLKPFDNGAVISAAKETGAIFTIEEHGLIGGLGSIVAEILLDSGFGNIKFKRFGLADKCHLEIGSQEYLRNKNELNPEYIALEILKLLKK